MIILGISAFYHDSAIALLENDKILFALQEERLSRIKADSNFPKLSIEAALNYINANCIGGGGVISSDKSHVNPTDMESTTHPLYGDADKENEVKSDIKFYNSENLYPQKWNVKDELCQNNTEKISKTLETKSVPQQSSLLNENLTLTLDSIDAFVFYDKPFLTFERLLETYFATVPHGFLSFIKAIPVWLSTKLFLKETIARELEALYKKLYPQKSKQEVKKFKQKVLCSIYFSEHHLSHCSSAFFPSPFIESGILTLDGIGEWATTTISKGKNNRIEILKELHFPHSLGLLYSAFTYYLGFKVNSGEYKVMGLAPYGEPKFVDIIKKHLIDIKPDGSFSLNMEYFSYTYGLKMTNNKFDSLFNAQRSPESKLEQIHMDIAASLQIITEEIMIALVRTTIKLSGSRNLVLSGGVALNCVGNGKIYQKLIKEEKILDHIWIQPASGDAGSALGCALGYYYMECNKPRSIHISNLVNDIPTPGTQHLNTMSEDSNTRITESNNMKSSVQHLPLLNDSMQGSYLGLSYSNSEVKEILDTLHAVYEKLDFNTIKHLGAKALSQGKVLGWHQGRCEFGPRALGARSILGDPRNTTMQKTMNLKIKYRESFRPFAPSVLDFAIDEWFECDYISPYMLLVAPVKKSKCYPLTKEQQELFGIEKLNIVRSEIPSVTHIDYSARIQSVHKNTNPRYYELIEEFYKLSDVPVLVNTSFNVRGEPMVCSPYDSYACFMGTEMDVLVVEDFILYKEKQPKENMIRFKDIKDKYELD